ncbi:MAG: protein usg [Thermaurantiacus sp.]
MNDSADTRLLRPQGYGLLTAEISYWMPDHPSILQLFVFQKHDVAPFFPVLGRFLSHWKREVEATMHMIRIAHSHWQGPTDWRAVDEILPMN